MPQFGYVIDGLRRETGPASPAAQLRQAVKRLCAWGIEASADEPNYGANHYHEFIRVDSVRRPFRHSPARENGVFQTAIS